MFKKIMLATDFSLCSMHAAANARELARRFDAKITLMYAFDHPITRDQAEQYLQILREERFQDDQAIELAAVQHRSADVAICGEAMVRGVDLIMAGRHGEHHLSERMLGSTTERVVRNAPCSVWVVHPAERASVAVTKHILAASDLSEESEPAIATAGAIARALDSWVTLVNVYDIFPALELLQQPYTDGVSHAFASRIEDQLEMLQKKHLEGVPAGVKVMRDKSVLRALCDLASDNDADLIVVGTHGLTGIRRFLIGSIAERVVRHAPCSVLVAR